MDDDEELIDQRHALFKDPIIGVKDVISDEHGAGARPAEPLPVPKEMSAAEWAEHSITHLKYHPGCPVCAATRRPNSHHRASHEHDRTIPLLVGDYCFPKSSSDGSTATVIVLKVYPFKVFFACVAPTKGADPLVVAKACHVQGYVSLACLLRIRS